VSEKFDKAVMANVQRERMKGLEAKRRIFLCKHGEWVTNDEVAKLLKIHRSTTTREMKNLKLAGLMEVAKRGRTYLYRAIKTKDIEFRLDMFFTVREIDSLEFDVPAFLNEPTVDYSWMPPMVRSWGGYRVAV